MEKLRINLNFKVSSQEKSKKTNSNNNTIIEKNLHGVIRFTPEDFKCYVPNKNKLYNIYSKDFSCKDKEYIYSDTLDKNGRRIMYNRSESNTNKILGFMPFAAGVIVNGNIIFDKILKQEVFHIKKTYIQNNKIIDNKLLELSKLYLDEFRSSRRKTE